MSIRNEKKTDEHVKFKRNQLCITIWKEGSPANIYLPVFKVKNKNTRKRCEICSKLTIKIPERHMLRRSGVFIVNLKHISHLFLVLLLLTLNK